MTNEAFVIVRGDDGALYYIGVTSARRDVAPTANMRIAVLGIEGRSPYEITAAALAGGSTSEAALAQLQAPQAMPAPPAATPAGSPSGPAAAAPPPSPQAPAGPTVNGATGVTPPASVATPAAPASGTSPAAPVSTPPASSSSPAPAVTPPAETAARGPAGATRAAAAAKPSGPAATAITPTAAVATAPMVPVDEKRWTELVGEVERFVGRTLILRVAGGRVSVDTSALSGNLERMVAPGSKVKVYGVPVELRFKALGFIDPDARGR